MDIKREFGNNVKTLRLRLGLSQEALALKAGIDRTYLPGIEKGVRNVSIVVMEKIANALKVSIKDLL